MQSSTGSTIWRMGVRVPPPLPPFTIKTDGYVVCGRCPTFRAFVAQSCACARRSLSIFLDRERAGAWSYLFTVYIHCISVLASIVPHFAPAHFDQATISEHGSDAVCFFIWAVNRLVEEMPKFTAQAQRAVSRSYRYVDRNALIAKTQCLIDYGGIALAHVFTHIRSCGKSDKERQSE